MDNTINISKTSRIIGWVLSILVILFLLFDVVGKFMKPEVVIKSTIELGYLDSTITLLGIILLICTALYAFPKTAILGAVLLTGYMGGAMATHIRVGNPLFTHILCPVYVAVFFWGGLYLRSAKLRRLVRNE